MTTMYQTHVNLMKYAMSEIKQNEWNSNYTDKNTEYMVKRMNRISN